MIDPAVEARFWPKVAARDSSECWEWMGYRNQGGYGILRATGGKKSWFAHRISAEINLPDFDPELYVCHKCDNPPCVNPAHLFMGTPADNMADAKAKGRTKLKRRPEPITACRRMGHDWTDPRNVYWEKKGTRRCAECSRQRQKQRYWAGKSEPVTP
jgi:hypothetical protein